MDTLPKNLDVDKVQTVEVELDCLRILTDLSGSENDWDLELSGRIWHEHLARDHWEIKIALLFEVRL
jgi:hypothetical protein